MENIIVEEIRDECFNVLICDQDLDDVILTLQQIKKKYPQYLRIEIKRIDYEYDAFVGTRLKTESELMEEKNQTIESKKQMIENLEKFLLQEKESLNKLIS